MCERGPIWLAAYGEYLVNVLVLIVKVDGVLVIARRRLAAVVCGGRLVDGDGLSLGNFRGIARLVHLEQRDVCLF
jgi:hypothetical protein